MSSEVLVKCWLCPESFGKRNELKDHAITSHGICRIVCPWCNGDEEKVLNRMSELTRHCKRKHNDLVLDLLEGDFFTEKNGFWLSCRPQDYIKVIKPTEWTSTIAIRTRAAILGWVERAKMKTRGKEQWEKGWKEALGHPVSSQAPARKRMYSPSRPSIDLQELEVAEICITGKSKVAFLQMHEESANLWFKVELVHWVLEDNKARDNLIRRMQAAKKDTNPPESFGAEIKLGEAKYTLAKVAKALGVGERHIRALHRGKVTIGKPVKTQDEQMQKDREDDKDFGEEPEYEIMDAIEVEDEEEGVDGGLKVVEEQDRIELAKRDGNQREPSHIEIKEQQKKREPKPEKRKTKSKSEKEKPLKRKRNEKEKAQLSKHQEESKRSKRKEREQEDSEKGSTKTDSQEDLVMKDIEDGTQQKETQEDIRSETSGGELDQEDTGKIEGSKEDVRTGTPGKDHQDLGAKDGTSGKESQRDLQSVTNETELQEDIGAEDSEEGAQRKEPEEEVGAEDSEEGTPCKEPEEDLETEDAEFGILGKTNAVGTCEDDQYDMDTDVEEPVSKDIRSRAELLLLSGGMPLYPPGRREWGSETVSLSSNQPNITWPPENWRDFSPEEKLTSWRFAATCLAWERGMRSCVNERDLLDEYAMLALPGTPIPKGLDKDPIIAARLANFRILKNIVEGKFTGTQAEDWLSAFEVQAAGFSRNRDLIKRLSKIPLRL